MQYAKQHGFDPYVFENWQHVPKFSFLSNHVSSILLFVNRDLSVIFREQVKSSCITRIASLEQSLPFSLSYRVCNNCVATDIVDKLTDIIAKRFLDNFAHTNGFSPLVPENWYQHYSKLSKVSV